MSRRDVWWDTARRERTKGELVTSMQATDILNIKLNKQKKSLTLNGKMEVNVRKPFPNMEILLDTAARQGTSVHF